MVYVAYSLKKTISEVLQSETMARFQILSRLLPQVEYLHYLRMQQAFQGVLPSSWEEYLRATSLKQEQDTSDLVQEVEIQAALADLSDLRRRSAEIATAKKHKRGG